MILKVLKLPLPKGSCNFENFPKQLYLSIPNCTRGHAISYTTCNSTIFNNISYYLNNNNYSDNPARKRLTELLVQSALNLVKQ